jgi:hypothetical protein
LRAALTLEASGRGNVVPPLRGGRFDFVEQGNDASYSERLALVLKGKIDKIAAIL